MRRLHQINFGQTAVFDALLCIFCLSQVLVLIGSDQELKFNTSDIELELLKLIKNKHGVRHSKKYTWIQIQFFSPTHAHVTILKLKT